MSDSELLALFSKASASAVKCENTVDGLVVIMSDLQLVAALTCAPQPM